MMQALSNAGVHLKDTGVDVREYIYDMPAVMRAADLVISRGGASTISELTALGMPSIIVPSPYVVNNHQEKNARVLEEAGGIRLILEAESSGEKLYDAAMDILGDSEKRARMHQSDAGLWVCPTPQSAFTRPSWPLWQGKTKRTNQNKRKAPPLHTMVQRMCKGGAYELSESDRRGAAARRSWRLQGAKNSVLPILAATLLDAAARCVLHHCPKLQDVDASDPHPAQLGCSAQWQGDTLCVHTEHMTCGEIPDPLMREMRSFVIFLGAILARCGEATLSYPRRCELGPRPIDLHLAALQAMGACIEERGGDLHCTRSGPPRL